MSGIEAAEIVRQCAQHNRQVHQRPRPQQCLDRWRQSALQGVHVDAGVQQQRRSDQRGGVGKVQFGAVAARQRPPEALRLDAA